MWPFARRIASATGRLARAVAADGASAPACINNALCTGATVTQALNALLIQSSGPLFVRLGRFCCIG